MPRVPALRILAFVLAAALAGCATSSGPRGALPPVPARPGLVADQELVPGKLRVRVFEAALPAAGAGASCWTFVSTGFAAHDHAEVVLSVQREPGDTRDGYPRDVLEVLAAMYRAVAAGQRLDAWSNAGVGEGLLGRKDLTGIMTVPAEGPPDLELPADAITFLLVTSAELEVAKSFGVARVSNMLGLAYRFYPTPWWVDRKRPPLGGIDAAGDSLLGKVERHWLGDAGAYLELASAPTAGAPDPRTGLGQTRAETHGRVQLRVTPASGKALRELLARVQPEGVLGLLVAPDEHAGGRLVWSPGAKAPQVITGPSGTTGVLAGNFVVLARGSDEPGARILEDGFVVFLSEAEWQALLAALAGGSAFALEGRAGQSSFALAWDVGGADDASGVKMTQIQLLLPEEVLARRSNAADLGRFLEGVEAVVREVAARRQPGAATLVIEFELLPGRKRRVTIAPPAGDVSWIADVQAGIAALPAVPVSDKVPLRVTFEILGTVLPN